MGVEKVAVGLLRQALAQRLALGGRRQTQPRTHVGPHVVTLRRRVGDEVDVGGAWEEVQHRRVRPRGRQHPYRRGQVAERREQLGDAAGGVRDRLVQGVDDEQHRRRVAALVEPLQRIAQRAVEARLVAQLAEVEAQLLGLDGDHFLRLADPLLDVDLHVGPCPQRVDDGVGEGRHLRRQLARQIVGQRLGGGRAGAGLAEVHRRHLLAHLLQSGAVVAVVGERSLAAEPGRDHALAGARSAREQQHPLLAVAQPVEHPRQQPGSPGEVVGVVADALR